MSNIKGDTCDVCFLIRLCVDFPTKKQICFAHAQRQREWARERKWAGVRKLPLGFPLLLMSFCVCLPFLILTSSVVYQFDCFIYFFPFSLSISQSLSLSFYLSPLSRSSKSKHRLTRNAGNVRNSAALKAKTRNGTCGYWNRQHFCCCYRG